MIKNRMKRNRITLANLDSLTCDELQEMHRKHMLGNSSRNDFDAPTYTNIIGMQPMFSIAALERAYRLERENRIIGIFNAGFNTNYIQATSDEDCLW